MILDHSDHGRSNKPMNPYPEGANLKAVQLQAIIVGKQGREVIIEYFFLVSYVPYFPHATL